MNTTCILRTDIDSNETRVVAHNTIAIVNVTKPIHTYIHLDRKASDIIEHQKAIVEWHLKKQLSHDFTTSSSILFQGNQKRKQFESNRNNASVHKFAIVWTEIQTLNLSFVKLIFHSGS